MAQGTRPSAANRIRAWTSTLAQHQHHDQEQTKHNRNLLGGGVSRPAQHILGGSDREKFWAPQRSSFMSDGHTTKEDTHVSTQKRQWCRR